MVLACHQFTEQDDTTSFSSSLILVDIATGQQLTEMATEAKINCLAKV